MIPRQTRESIDSYANDGIPTGGFLRAVLAKDLFEAFGRADLENRAAMFDIVSYIWNNTPSVCWGNYALVDGWIERKAEERRAAKREVQAE